MLRAAVIMDHSERVGSRNCGPVVPKGVTQDGGENMAKARFACHETAGFVLRAGSPLCFCMKKGCGLVRICLDNPAADLGEARQDFRLNNVVSARADPAIPRESHGLDRQSS